nr:putative reverse transcriptase domain-containing protein [Tanacetum cinerariifolium]
MKQPKRSCKFENTCKLREIDKEVTPTIGPVAYKLELPEELSNLHNTFHISNLKKCISGESLIILMKELKLDDKLNFVEELVEIMDREIKQLRQSRIPIIKVRWNSKRGPKYMWERKDEIREWTCFKDLLQKFSHHGLDLWLQIQIFYDHVDNTIQRSIDYAAGRRLRKLRLDKAWSAIKRLAQYENEGWNDAFVPEDVSLNYENPNIKQLLGIMEHKVNTLMKDAISLMGKSKRVFQLATNKMYQSPSEPSRQEEFKHIMMNFVLDQEERIRQLEYYMQAITDEFMKFSLEVTQRLKEHIMANENKPKKIIQITRYLDTKPTISDGRYNVGNTKAKSIMNPRIKLAHRCITMTITGRKETTNRFTKTNLFYLYCIFGEGVVCNIPYWIAKYLKSVREKNVIFRGMFVTKIAWSFSLLTNELVSVLNRETPPHVYRKNSLIKMGVIMEVYEGECCWPATREVAGEGRGDDEEGDGKGGNEGIGGSADIYHNMSQGEWKVNQAQWMGQQDER